jgi:hypothetical protein
MIPPRARRRYPPLGFSRIFVPRPVGPAERPSEPHVQRRDRMGATPNGRELACEFAAALVDAAFEEFSS